MLNLWLWIFLVMVVLTIIAIFIFYKNKTLSQKLERIVSIIAIITILFAIFTYWNDQTIKEQNNNIIMENLKIELTQNLNLTELLIGYCPSYLMGSQFTVLRYSNYYLEKSLDVETNKTIREELMSLNSWMQGDNLRMNGNNNFVTFSSEQEFQQFIGLRKENLNAICSNAKAVKKEIEQLLIYY